MVAAVRRATRAAGAAAADPAVAGGAAQRRRAPDAAGDAVAAAAVAAAGAAGAAATQPGTIASAAAPCRTTGRGRWPTTWPPTGTPGRRADPQREAVLPGRFASVMIGGACGSCQIEQSGCSRRHCVELPAELPKIRGKCLLTQLKLHGTDIQLAQCASSALLR